MRVVPRFGRKFMPLKFYATYGRAEASGVRLSTVPIAAVAAVAITLAPVAAVAVFGAVAPVVGSGAIRARTARAAEPSDSPIFPVPLHKTCTSLTLPPWKRKSQLLKGTKNAHRQTT